MAHKSDKPVRIGDAVRFTPSGWEGKTEFANGMACPASVTGRVIYVHPRGRFCTAEARIGGETLRESLPLRDGVRP